MSLRPEYYELLWQGLKTHEFRRRYLKGRLIAVIDLAEAVVGPPRSIAEIAERP